MDLQAGRGRTGLQPPGAPSGDSSAAPGEKLSRGEQEWRARNTKCLSSLETKRCLLLTTAASATHTIRRCRRGRGAQEESVCKGKALTSNNGVVVMVMSLASAGRGPAAERIHCSGVWLQEGCLFLRDTFNQRPLGSRDLDRDTILESFWAGPHAEDCKATLAQHQRERTCYHLHFLPRM